MTTPLLASKLYIPHERANWAARQRLLLRCQPYHQVDQIGLAIEDGRQRPDHHVLCSALRQLPHRQQDPAGADP